MRVRKLGVFIAALMASMGLFVPSAPAATVNAPVSVCIVAGNVSLGASQTWIPGPTPPSGGGNYNFQTVALACAGIVIAGVCPGTTSGGTTDGTSPTSGFRGTFNSGVCIGLGNCIGDIGGPSAQSTGNVEPNTGLPTNPYDAPNLGPWSYTRGPFIAGTLSDVRCTGGVVGMGPGQEFGAGNGLVALVAGPDPTSAGFGVGVGTPGGPDSVIVTYSAIVVAGVAIITAPVV